MRDRDQNSDSVTQSLVLKARQARCSNCFRPDTNSGALNRLEGAGVGTQVQQEPILRSESSSRNTDSVLMQNDARSAGP